MARRGDMQEVELLDGDDDVTEPLETAARPRRAHRWWIAAGVAVVALSLVGTQLVVDAREDAAAARLAAVPGAFPPIGDELVIVRTLPEAEAATLWGGVEIGAAQTGSLVVAPDGSQSFTATDLRTGATLWSTPLLGPDAERAASLENSYGGGCVADTEAGVPAAVAVCLVTDGFVLYDGEGGSERVPATSSEVVVLDTGDGHVVGRWDADPAAQVAALDGLALVGTRDAEGRVEIVAHDVRTGAQRWRYDEPVEDRADGVGSAVEEYWTVMRVGEVIGFSRGGNDALTLLSATGSVIRDDLETSNQGWGYGADPATGVFAITTYSATGAQTTTLLAPDGDPSGDLAVSGELVQVVLDDGSLPDLVLTRFAHLHAYDRATGAERWEADVEPGYSAMVARGYVYLTTSTEVVALDGRTGAVAWRTELPQLGSSSVATDGRDLLVMTASDGVDGRMTGFDLATGEQTRQIAYPEGVSDVLQVHGVLVGWSYATNEVTVLE
jgi:outer membrane protein assembly factor BamB